MAVPSLTIALVLTLVVARSYGSTQDVQVFEEGNKYTYSYEAVMYTGISYPDSKQYAGSALKATLNVYYNDEEVVFKLSNVKRGRVNQTNLNADEEIRVYYDVESHEGLQSDLDDLMTQPIFVKYEKGFITSTKYRRVKPIEEETVHWRKAIASLFQGDFQRFVDHTSLEYEHEEDGVGGLCFTSYAGKSISIPNKLKIQKTRHYDRCSHRHHYFHSSVSGIRCSHENEKGPYEAQGFVDYLLDQGHDGSLKIEEITGSGKIILSPFGNQGNVIHSLVNQHLVLNGVERSDTSPVQASKKFQESSSLSYMSLHDKTKLDRVNLYNAHYFNRYVEDAHPNRLNEAEQAFPSSDQDGKTQFAKLLQLLKTFQTFNYDDFVQFFDKKVDMKKMNYKTQIALEVLPVVGTNPAILYLLKQIEDHNLDESLALKYIASIPLHAKEPTPALMHVFWRFINEDTMRTREILFTTSWLAFGSLLYRGCVKDDFTPRTTNLETYASLDKCKHYLDRMILAFYEEKIPELKMLLLRAIKNTHLRTEKMEDFLKNILKANYRTLIRREALLAVLDYYVNRQRTKGVDFSNETLYEMSEQIFLDTSEDHAVRMAAFEVIAKAVSTKEKAEKIVLKYLVEEKSQNVAGFMYSTLEYLVNSSTPCDRIYVSLYGDAMKSVTPVEVDPLMQGFNVYDTFYNEQFNIGQTSQFQTIASNSSIIPVGLYFKESMDIMDYHVDTVELGTFVKGSTLIFDSLLALQGKTSFGKPIWNIKSWKHLNNVKEFLETDDEAESYLSNFNQDLMVIYWHRLFNSVTPGAKSPYVTEEINYSRHYFKRSVVQVNLNVKDLEYGAPNELGIPVVMSMLIPTQSTNIAAVTNYLLRGGIMDLTSSISCYSGMLATMEVKSAYSEHGFRENTFERLLLPINIKLNLPGQSGELIPSESFDFVTYQAKLETFDDHDNIEIRPDELVMFEQKIGHDYFGVGATVNAAFDPIWLEPGLYRVVNDINTINDFESIFEALQAIYTFSVWNPTQRSIGINVRIEPSPENPTKSFEFSSFDVGGKLHDFVKVAFEVSGHGPIPRHWEIDFSFDSENRSKKKTSAASLTFKRGPIPNYDLNKYEMCLSFNNAIEKMSQVFLEPSGRTLFPTLLFNAKLTSGQSCSSSDAKIIKIKGLGQVSEQKKNALGMGDRCLQNLNTETIEFCLIETAKSGEFDEFSADIEYQNMATNPEDKFTYDWMRQLFHCNRTQDDLFFSTPIDDGKVRITANHLYDSGAIDLSVHKVENQSIQVITQLRDNGFLKLEEFQTVDTIGRFQMGFGNSRQATCYFTVDHFDTFDEVQYKYKFEDQDYHVVMTHCQSQNFAIRIRKSNENGIEMMINVGVLRITITPLLDKVVLADESRVQMQQRYVRRLPSSLDKQEECTSTLCTIRDPEGSKIFVSVERTDDYHGYYIKSEPFMLDMFFNGKVGIISASMFYKGKQCGLCGNFDGEKVHEFEGPDGFVHKSAENFVRSFASSQ